MLEIHLILGFMIIAAIVAVEVKDLLSSVVVIGAVGIGLSMAFLVLKAPDLAMLQLVVEILSLILLVRATLRKDLPFSTSGRWLFNTFSTVSFMVIFIVLAYFCIKNMPDFGEPTMKVSKAYLQEGLIRTGARNIVASITLNFRALDTLAEATALFTSIIGVLVVARKIGRYKEF